MQRHGIQLGTSAISYIRTSAGYVADSARNAFPVGFEIDRARNMLRDLEPDVRENMYAIAKEKVEIKNLNSFRAVHRSLAYEIERQSAVLAAAGQVKQDTMGWHEGRRQTFSQRGKEEAHDYRYFPDPDLLLKHLLSAYDEIEQAVGGKTATGRARVGSDKKRRRRTKPDAAEKPASRGKRTSREKKRKGAAKKKASGKATASRRPAARPGSKKDRGPGASGGAGS